MLQKADPYAAVRERYLKNIQTKYLGKQSEARKFRRARNLVGFTLGATVLAIYSYALYAVGNETIMDDIDNEVRQAANEKATQ